MVTRWNLKFRKVTQGKYLSKIMISKNCIDVPSGSLIYVNVPQFWGNVQPVGVVNVVNERV
jgi:hypothetical protein